MTSDTTTGPGHIEVRSRPSVEEFYAEYVNVKPVVMKGALKNLPAYGKWTIPYLAELAPDMPARLKTGNLADGNIVTQALSQYSRFVEDVAEGKVLDDGTPPYLHDLPLFSMIPALLDDVEPFPAELLPKFFRDRWSSFPQFFVGPRGSVTPLHFDTLQTHNLFFQLHGSKRFRIIDAASRGSCYLYNWRWSEVDAENPDFERHPLFRDVTVRECVVEAGDLLYMPPGALHHVRSLSSSISFNIDWHDRRSALRGLTAFRHGMPVRNLRYNAVLALGVVAGVPLPVLMPALRSYFTYLS